MSSTRLILISYLKRDFDTIAASVLAPLFLFFGIIGALTSDRSITSTEASGPIFLVMLISTGYASFVVSYGIRHILETGTGHLLPHFRQRHLQVSAFVLLPFLVLPTIVVARVGFPILNSLAMLLLMCTLSAWTTLILGNTLFSGMVLLLTLRTFYELLGLADQTLILASVDQFLTPFQSTTIPLSCMVLAVIGIIAFSRYVFTAQILRGTKEHYPYAGLLPTPTNTPTDLVRRNLQRQFEANRRRSTFSDTGGLLRLSLFSPDYGFHSLFLRRSLPTYVGMTCGLALLLLVVSRLFEPPGSVTPSATVAAVVFAMYQFIALALSTDFLVHRNQLSSLWMASSLSTRAHFMRAVVLTYLGVASRIFLWPTVTILAAAAFTPLLEINVAISVAAMGFAAFLIMVALSLLVVPAVRSENCTGWVIPNFFVLVVLLQVLWLNGFFARTDTVLLSAVTLSGLGAFLLCAGAAVLPDVELDFRGPEMP